MIHRAPIAIEPGARVRYLGSGLSRGDGASLVPSALGVVQKVFPPRHGTGEPLEDDLVDRGRDGSASVKWEGWPETRAIHADSEGKTWERVVG